MQLSSKSDKFPSRKKLKTSICSRIFYRPQPPKNSPISTNDTSPNSDFQDESDDVTPIKIGQFPGSHQFSHTSIITLVRRLRPHSTKNAPISTNDISPNSDFQDESDDETPIKIRQFPGSHQFSRTSIITLVCRLRPPSTKNVPISTNVTSKNL